MKKILLILTAIVSLSSCAKKEISAPATKPSEERREVSFMAKAAETKTLLSDDNKVVWEAEDAIMLKFTKGSSVRTEEFVIEGEGGSVTARFNGSIPTTFTIAGGYSNDVYAVYPSSAMNSLTGDVTFTLAAEQQVASGSFPSGKNLSSAKISLNNLNDGSVTDALMQNALAILRFVLPEHVASVEITGTAGLTGDATLTFNESGRLTAASSSSNSITITPSEGDTFVAGETYNVLVYPGSHSSLSVKLTHDDGCQLEKILDGEYEFSASKVYEFDIKSQFQKDYTFTADGIEVVEGEQLLTVFPDYQQLLNTLPTRGSAEFKGVLPESIVHSAEPVIGWALYPASYYDNDVITYDLPATGLPAGLWSALLVSTELVAEESAAISFNSVEDCFAQLKLTVPEGVKSVDIVSDKGISGSAVMEVDSEGKLVVINVTGTEVTIDTTSGESFMVNVFPVEGAVLKVTLTDNNGATIEKELTLDIASGDIDTETLDFSGEIDFDKNGDFGNEGFESSGDKIEI